MSTPRVLLTNDDGIDAPGLAGLYEELTAVANVTVVAPTDNRSGTGRTRTHRAAREDHPWGFALDGTPADCVAYATGGLDAEFDLVVAGCNHGPNTGNYVVGRSGTVGACIEAAFLDIPAIAVSAYHANDFFIHPPEEYEFARPASVTRELVVRARSASIFEDVDLLNVNVPIDVPDSLMRLTEPYHDYDIHVEHEVTERDEADTGNSHDGDIAIRDRVWPDTVGWENPFPVDKETRERYPVGTDRRALIDGEISVSPITAPAIATQTDTVQQIIAGFNESEAARQRAHNEENET